MLQKDTTARKIMQIAVVICASKIAATETMWYGCFPYRLWHFDFVRIEAGRNADVE
jgi:hypothetical protein